MTEHPDSETGHLPTLTRSVLAENRAALERRWEVARNTDLDSRALNRWYPGQRQLLDLLAVLDSEELLRLADCGTPLFHVQLRAGHIQPETCAGITLTQATEIAAAEEAFLALSARLDAVRTALAQACVLYDLKGNEAAWISRFCPHELRMIAKDQSMVLKQSASYEYFAAAASRLGLKRHERTLLAAISRNKRSSQ